ncbi:MAG: c-type cytochrome [Methylococcaceae bacterium]|nr:c-type cytochrome [Methylococcaceae bacterium]
MKRHKPSILNTILAAFLALFCLSANAEVDVDAAKALAKQNGCFRCHGVDKDKDGPAWKKIAAKFKVDPKGEEKLLHHLSSGEKAKFPDGHEEPHMILKSDDPKETQNLVDWILSL